MLPHALDNIDIGCQCFPNGSNSEQQESASDIKSSMALKNIRA